MLLPRHGTVHARLPSPCFLVAPQIPAPKLSSQLTLPPDPARASRVGTARKFAVKADMATALRSTLPSEMEIQTPRVMADVIGPRSTLMQVIQPATWAIP